MYPFKYSSLAQSVERMTVNHDVAGSSPAGGANRKNRYVVACLFFLFTFLVGSEPSRRHDSQCLPFAAMKSRRCGRRDRKVNLPFGRSSRRTNVMSQRAQASAGSSPAGGAKEKQIANRRSAFLSFVLLGLNRIAIMIRNVFRFCLQMLASSEQEKLAI